MRFGLSRHAPIAVALIATLVLASSASGHVVFGTPSLAELVRDSDLVVRARVTVARRMLRVDARQRPVVEATVLETLHGDRVRQVTFVPHGHGVAEYHDGEEALIFLRRIARVPELATTPLAARVEWASLQETTDAIPLGPRTRGPWLDATRRYLRAQALADPAARRAALRETTIALLGAAEPRVAASALRVLVAAGDAFAIGPVDRARLDALIARRAAPVTVRIGVLAELERRGLVDGAPRWARLLDTTRGTDLRSVVRAAATHPSPAVTRTLVRIATGRDVELAAEAAVALGTPGNDAAVEPLAHLLSHADSRVRFAAVRGLGRTGTPHAIETLRHAAAFHTDPSTRRRAGAEVAVLERSRPTVARARP
jgi:hypothetical protein